jgi:hypothetical protein
MTEIYHSKRRIVKRYRQAGIGTIPTWGSSPDEDDRRRDRDGS